MKKTCLIIILVISSLIILSLLMTLFQKDAVTGEKIGLIKVEGPILTSWEAIEELKNYRENKSIRAIVLRVDSPGGAVAPSQEIYEEVKKTAKEKPVVVSMGAVAASGGYYISAAASRIIANPGTLTGSIGVIMEIPNIKGLMDKIGIKTEVIKSGRYKDLASVFKDMEPDQRKILQSVLDEVHEQFIKAVSEGRNIPVEEVRKIADGRVFTGSQALSLGLVDELGNIEDAIKKAAELSGIKGRPEIVTKEEGFSLKTLLKNSLPDRLMEEYTSVKVKYIFIP
ncbi:MAG: signal peptide peptidase SppA [Thermodesulfovibrionales bacterium]|nr:signal peptide peptidase SppA [Thermodesulfovibrionales bacterium]